MTALESLAIYCTVAACAFIALVDPAQRVRKWWRGRVAKSADARGLEPRAARREGSSPSAPTSRGGGEGAAPAVVAPSPATEPIFFEACLPKREVVRINAQLAWQPAQHGMRAEA